jgi:hypothetical protein
MGSSLPKLINLDSFSGQKRKGRKWEPKRFKKTRLAIVPDLGKFSEYSYLVKYNVQTRKQGGERQIWTGKGGSVLHLASGTLIPPCYIGRSR